MTNETMITGELKSDMRFLLNEIRRVSKIFNDIKKRGLELEDELRQWDRIATIIAMGEERKEDLESSKKRFNSRREEFSFKLEAYITEDKRLIQEIDRVRKIIDRIRILLHSPASLTYAENLIRQTEENLRQRLQAGQNCAQAFKPDLKKMTTFEPAAPGRLELGNAGILWGEVNTSLLVTTEATRQAMINVLKAYKFICQKYPLLKANM